MRKRGGKAKIALSFLTLIAVAAAVSGCSNQKRAEQSYYCAPGYYMSGGQCLPEAAAGDRDADVVRPGDGEADHTENAVENDIDDENGKRLVATVPDVLAVGRSVPLRAYYYPGGDAGREDVSGSVEWTSFNLAVLRVGGSPPLLEGIGEGEASLRAHLRSRGLFSLPYIVRVKPRPLVEARGIWVNRWAYRSAEDIVAIIEKAGLANFNQVYFQVRGVFDSYYSSSLEPWAKRLSGVLGRDPGWDPLRTAIDAAHGRGLELHAWINVFTLWEGNRAPEESNPRHAYLSHPDWVAQNDKHIPMPLGGGYIWASPGNPELRSHNSAVAVEIATRYDVDGIHLDRVRYPGPNYSHDPVSENLYRLDMENRPGLSYADWERERVLLQVGEIYAALASSAPGAVVSAAVAGITVDEWGWASVTEGYNDWLQDARAMDEGEVVDALVPMVYWPCTDEYGAYTDFRALVDSHAAHVSRRFLFIGSDLKKAQDAESRRGNIPRGYESFEQIERQIVHSRNSETEGWMLYDYGGLEGAGYWGELREGPFAQPADIPFMWWRAGSGL